jgi:D-alanine transaminase
MAGFAPATPTPTSCAASPAATLLSVIKREGMEVDERPFTPAEAVAAREAFITGAGTLVLPVVAVDGKKVGEGRPGPVATKLRRLYIEQAKATAV